MSKLIELVTEFKKGVLIAAVCTALLSFLFILLANSYLDFEGKPAFVFWLYVALFGGIAVTIAQVLQLVFNRKQFFFAFAGDSEDSLSNNLDLVDGYEASLILDLLGQTHLTKDLNNYAVSQNYQKAFRELERKKILLPKKPRQIGHPIYTLNRDAAHLIDSAPILRSDLEHKAAQVRR